MKQKVSPAVVGIVLLVVVVLVAAIGWSVTAGKTDEPEETPEDSAAIMQMEGDGPSQGMDGSVDSAEMLEGG